MRGTCNPKGIAPCFEYDMPTRPHLDGAPPGETTETQFLVARVHSFAEKEAKREGDRSQVRLFL